MITHTTAIVLSSIDYQESSKIITVLSKAHGKIALIARGVKKPKNKLSGVIEIGHILDVVYYFKPTRNVQNLTEATLKSNSLNFRQDFERASILYATLELINQLIHENEENRELFNFLLIFVQWLAEFKPIKPSIFCYVQLRSAELIGFNLALESDDINVDTYFDIPNGVITNLFKSELSFKLTPFQHEFLRSALTSKSEGVFKIDLKGMELKKLIHHFDVYFKYHVEGYKDRKSDAIFDQMLKNAT